MPASGPCAAICCAPSGRVGADQGDPLDLAGLIEELGHRRLDLGVGHPLLGTEDDGSPLATRRRPSEMLLEDVEALSALDVGQGELGAVGGADHRIGQDATEYQGGEPSQGNLAPVAKTPTSKTREQTDSFDGPRQITGDWRAVSRGCWMWGTEAAASFTTCQLAGK